MGGPWRQEWRGTETLVAPMIAPRKELKDFGMFGFVMEVSVVDGRAEEEQS
jgi:hypothetical protein